MLTRMIDDGENGGLCDTGVPPALLGPERFLRRRSVSPKSTGVGTAVPIRSRFNAPDSIECPVGFRRLGAQCVAIETVAAAATVSRRRAAAVTRSSGKTGLLQMAIELGRVKEVSRVHIEPPPIAVNPRAARFIVKDRPVKDRPAPILVGNMRFIDANRDGVDDRNVAPAKSITEKRGPERTTKTKDFCPSCERQSPKSKGIFDSRPAITDLSPKDAGRGSKNILIGVALFVAAIVGLKAVKVF